MQMLIARATRADWPAIRALLAHDGLPPDGLADHLSTTLLARSGDEVIGSAALELYPPVALLRSVAVHPAYRGQGLGRRLTEAALALGQESGVTAVYLLTTTAAGYFPRLGFQPVDRAAVAPAITQSVEWTHACPASAQVLVCTLVS